MKEMTLTVDNVREGKAWFKGKNGRGWSLEIQGEPPPAGARIVAQVDQSGQNWALASWSHAGGGGAAPRGNNYSPPAPSPSDDERQLLITSTACWKEIYAVTSKGPAVVSDEEVVRMAVRSARLLIREVKTPPPAQREPRQDEMPGQPWPDDGYGPR